MKTPTSNLNQEINRMIENVLINDKGKVVHSPAPISEMVSLGVPYFLQDKPISALDLVHQMFGVSKTQARKNPRKYTISGEKTSIDETIDVGNITCVVIYGRERGLLVPSREPLNVKEK